MYTLLTGATGLVGRYLVRDLLLNDHPLAVVVRPSRRCSPQLRVEELLQHWERELGRTLPRPVVLSGDICEPGFGLSEADTSWVREHCSRMIHSAAILEFYGSDRAGEPWRTNLTGTQHMIELCRELGIRDIHYVSTAYVAGMQEGRIMEDSLDAGQSFRNDYEESKFCAEKLVRAIDFADHVTVYRPAVIAGDSRTGYTNTYHGIYLYLRLMAVMMPALPLNANGKRLAPIRLHMTGNERRNIIPVDWVSQVMTRLLETPAARGLTFHIAPKNPITAGEIIRWIADYFHAEGVEFCGPESPEETPVQREDNEDQWLFERMYKENMTTYAPYERTDNLFDVTNTDRFAGDIVCPEMDRTVIYRYIEYGNEDRWGKRRPELVEPVFQASDFFNELPRRAGAGNDVQLVGVDLTGPGGAQLTLQLSRAGLTHVQRGLPEHPAPILRLPVQEFVSAVESQGGSFQKLMSAWDTTGAAAQELTEMLVTAVLPEPAEGQTMSADSETARSC